MRVMRTNRILIDFVSVVASDQSRVSHLFLTALKSQLRVRNTAVGEKAVRTPLEMVEENKDDDSTYYFFLLSSGFF